MRKRRDYDVAGVVPPIDTRWSRGLIDLNHIQWNISLVRRCKIV